ncbi:uncharacterized protein LOC142977330 [Anticarsia gemmatalis]|uniref:uncharacterized protein LOC142977330 n=1 Tax=Anticarsia gemmatalis TaxID=129554 RepID=UPI003F765E58
MITIFCSVWCKTIFLFMAKFWFTVCIHAVLLLIIYGATRKKSTAIIPTTVDPTAQIRNMLRRGTDDDVYSSQQHPKGRCMCSSIYQPLCASNNKSYFNACELHCYAKRSNLTLAVKHRGICIRY